MKCKAIITSILAISTLLSAACSSSRAIQAAGPGDDMIVLPIEVRHEAIPAVSPGKAIEMKITLPQDIMMPQVVALPGGGALALGQKVTYNASKGIETSKLMAAKYDAKGKTLWTKMFSALADGAAQYLKPLPDGGFIFTYGALVKYSNGQNTPYTQYLVFCDGNGNVLQKYGYDKFGVIEYLCMTDTGETYAVGEGFFRGGTLVTDPGFADNSADVSIMKFDKGGKQLFCRRFGGSGFDRPVSASWSKETGLVVAVSAEKADGDIPPPAGVGPPVNGSIEILAAFDGNGNRKWLYCDSEQSNLCYSLLLPTSEGTLCQGYKGSNAFFLKLDGNGKKSWETSADGIGVYSILCAACDADGGFSAAINWYGDGDPNHGENEYLALYDKDGQTKRKIKLPHEMLREILPTEDGGLITVGIQNVKALPQPMYVSSIWYDTETIVTKYDANLSIQWRKVYDKHKDSTMQDIAVPEASGAVIVEK